MKCLECGRKMTKGYIQSSKLVLWSEKKRQMLLDYVKNGDVKVSKYGLIGSYAESYYCENCKYIRTEIRTEN